MELHKARVLILGSLTLLTQGTPNSLPYAAILSSSSQRSTPNSPPLSNTMAFTSILRRSASSLAPLATRLVRGQRSYHAAVFTAINHSSFAARKPTIAPQNPRYYFKADDSLLRVIDAEIQCAEETDEQEVRFFSWVL